MCYNAMCVIKYSFCLKSDSNGDKETWHRVLEADLRRVEALEERLQNR